MILIGEEAGGVGVAMEVGALLPAKTEELPEAFVLRT
jgi:hypothetical protein